jgi:hypothetical protein
VKTLRYIPLAIAGWCRYLVGINDSGEAMPLSPDPMLDELKGYFCSVRIGDKNSAEGLLKPILSNTKLFGLNLYESGLGELIEDYFGQMIAGKHAVREVLTNILDKGEVAFVLKMTFRWFGEKDDSITLSQIRQIPAVTGVVGALYDYRSARSGPWIKSWH